MASPTPFLETLFIALHREHSITVPHPQKARMEGPEEASPAAACAARELGAIRPPRPARSRSLPPVVSIAPADRAQEPACAVQHAPECARPCSSAIRRTSPCRASQVVLGHAPSRPLPPLSLTLSLLAPCSSPLQHAGPSLAAGRLRCALPRRCPRDSRSPRPSPSPDPHTRRHVDQGCAQGRPTEARCPRTRSTRLAQDVPHVCASPLPTL